MKAVAKAWRLPNPGCYAGPICAPARLVLKPGKGERDGQEAGRKGEKVKSDGGRRDRRRKGSPSSLTSQAGSGAGNSGGNRVASAEGLAPNWQTRQPVGVFGLRAAKHGPKLLHIVPAFGGDLVAHPPDFVKNFVFHSLIIPLIRVACR